MTSGSSTTKQLSMHSSNFYPMVHHHHHHPAHQHQLQQQHHIPQHHPHHQSHHAHSHAHQMRSYHHAHQPHVQYSAAQPSHPHHHRYQYQPQPQPQPHQQQNQQLPSSSKVFVPHHSNHPNHPTSVMNIASMMLNHQQQQQFHQQSSSSSSAAHYPQQQAHQQHHASVNHPVMSQSQYSGSGSNKPQPENIKLSTTTTTTTSSSSTSSHHFDQSHMLLLTNQQQQQQQQQNYSPFDEFNWVPQHQQQQQPSSSSNIPAQQQASQQHHLSMIAPSTVLGAEHQVNNSFFSKGSPVSLHRNHVIQAQHVNLSNNPTSLSLLLSLSNQQGCFSSPDFLRSKHSYTNNHNNNNHGNNYDPWSTIKEQSPCSNFNMWSSHQVLFSSQVDQTNNNMMPSSPQKANSNSRTNTNNGVHGDVLLMETQGPSSPSWHQQQQQQQQQSSRSSLGPIPFNLADALETVHSSQSNGVQQFASVPNNVFSFGPSSSASSAIAPVPLVNHSGGGGGGGALQTSGGSLGGNGAVVLTPLTEEANSSSFASSQTHSDKNASAPTPSATTTSASATTSPKKLNEKSKLNPSTQPFVPTSSLVTQHLGKSAPPSPSHQSQNWFDNFRRGPNSPNHHHGNGINNKNLGSPSKNYGPKNGSGNSNGNNMRGKVQAARVLSFDMDKESGQSAPAAPVETPQCRQLYKEFLQDMKQILEETKGEDEEVFEALKQFVADNIESRVPETIWWRVYLFLAEHAKRHNFISEARNYYKKVNTLQPTASQGWLEHAKLEEECGNLQRCKHLINCGLQYCQTNENLLIKGIKQYAEQLNDMNGARALLSRLRGVPLEKCWKIMLEGALLESRVGNIQIARKVFKHLMQNVSRHGPVYYEAYRLEERMEQYDRALTIVERGLTANPRYGPLWFAALRLYEKIALDESDKKRVKIDLSRVRNCIQRAVENISKELIWKVWFESAQIEERAGNLEASRKSYTKSVMTCMKNLRWKVWLAGSRTELNFGNMEISRLLLNRALTEVPTKTKAVVLIECARLEEYSGDINKAREYLQRAQKEARHEWKVYLESILLETRAGQTQRAIAEAEKALEIHRSTGRLWAVLIQLKQCEGEEEQMKVFKQALNEVPKSGEVWCEGARIRLNPMSPRFHLQKARQYLEFAIKFTPQYGDSFIEYLRLELLSKGPRMGKHHYCIDGGLGQEEEEGNIHIEQLCVNADPNYGPLWFHCKAHALDSSRLVLVRAKDYLIKELLQYRTLYQRAIMREYSPRDVVSDSESDSEECSSDDEESITPEHFVTGLYALQRQYNKSHTNLISDELRKKYIFGSESPGGLVL